MKGEGGSGNKRSFHRFNNVMIEFMKEIKNIFLLQSKKARGGANHLDAQEIVNVSQILHSKLV